MSPSNTTTSGGVEDTTFTGTSITLVILFPSLSLYSTVTVAGVCTPVLSVPGVVSTFVTVTVTPSGRPLSFLAASSAFSLTIFANSVLSASLGTVTPSGLTFGNTVTGTVTSSGSFTPLYVTGTFTFTSVAPTLPSVVGIALLMSSSVTGVLVPSVSGVIALFTSSAFGLSPSTTYTGLTSEPLTFTVTGIVVV